MIVRQKRIGIQKGFIGVISDTHGLVRPEALAALQGVELIIHAGDIGKVEVLQSLSAIAPVVAIRGNNDREAWATKLPDIINLRINSFKFQVIHDVNDLALDPVRAGIRAVISGHSHKPSSVQREGVLFVNPGSAGPRRFRLPIAIARLSLTNTSLHSEIVEVLK